MKKEETGKKSKLGLWIAIGVVVLLAIVGVVLALLLGGESEEPGKQAGGRAELYWNVDRLDNVDPESGLSIRKPGEDGVYYIRFAIDGEQVELPVADKKLVNRIDVLEVMGLEFDADGTVIDLVSPESIATLVADKFYVQTVDGNTVTLNSSQALNGMPQTITLSEESHVYNVTSQAEVVGEFGEMEPMDQVIVFADDKGTITHVYITSRPLESKVYWRMDRFYDSTNKVSTREKNEEGYWEIPFVVDGEHVVLKTKLESVVNSIDSSANTRACFGLEFDEEGFIISKFAAALAVRGSAKALSFDITELNGDAFTAECHVTGSTQGQTYSNVLTPETRIYNVSSTAKHFGEPTELQMGDFLYVLENAAGDPVIIFVVNRMVGGPMYYNAVRYWSNASKSTTREPDADGWYRIWLAADGKLSIYRTKDIDIVNKLESYNLQCFGLIVEGDVIKAVSGPETVTGYYSFAGNQWVTGVAGVVVSTQNSAGTSTSNGIMSTDCKVYDVSGNASYLGEPTELRVGDQIVGYKNPQGEVAVIFVKNRAKIEGTKLYWSISRKFDNKKRVTKREPDADGWYVFDVVEVGKGVTQVKTKSKAMADKMDSYYVGMFALSVNKDGVVTGAYQANTITSGTKGAQNTFFQEVLEDGSYRCVSASGSLSTLKVAPGVKAYNVSTGFDSFRGEQTTLKRGDKIVALRNSDLTAQIVLVIDREIESPLYYNNLDRQYNSTDKVTTREPNAEGYYVFNLAVNGQVKTLKTKDKDIATAVDSKGYAFGLKVKGDIIQQVYSAATTQAVNDNYPSQGRDYDVMKINGRNISLLHQWPYEKEENGDTAELKLAANCKVYDVSKYAGDQWGKEVKLQLGDRVDCYANPDGEIICIFIRYRNTHEKGHISYCEHCGKNVFWEPFGTSFYKVDCHYYLTHDYVNASQENIGYDWPEPHDIVLDLNGKNYTTTGSRAFLVSEGCKFTILDTTGKGCVVSAPGITGGAWEGDAEQGGVFMVSRDAVLDLRAGTYTRTADAALVDRGGILSVSGSGARVIIGKNVTFTGGWTEPGKDQVTDENGNTVYEDLDPKGGNIYINGGIVDLYGTVIGGSAGGNDKGNGGNIYIIDGTLNAYKGAVITGGTADYRGGNIYSSAGKANISGATIEAGESATHGGSIYATSGSEMKFSDNATVTGGKAVSSGGNMYFNNSKLTVTNSTIANGEAGSNGGNIYIYNTDSVLNITGSTVKGGYAGSNGGNIYGNTSVLNISGGAVEAGVADGNGGNVYVTSSCEVNISDSTVISGGNASTSGGNLYINNSKLDASKSSIAKGVATTSGGNIYGSGSELKITDCNVKTGEAGNHGGNIYAYNGAAAITGGTIEAGSADSNGGNIYGSGAVLNISGCTIKAGEAVGNGGNIYATSNSELNVADSTISDGEAGYGGNVSLGSGTFTLSGNTNISSGTAASGGDNVYVSNPNANVVIGDNTKIDGGVQIDNAKSVTIKDAPTIEKAADGSAYSLMLDSGVVADINELTGGKILVTADGIFTTTGDPDVLEGFLTNGNIVAENGYTIDVVEDALFASDPTAAERETCLYGHTRDEHEDPNNTCTETEFYLWEDWTATDSLPNKGAYVLTENVSITGLVEVTDELVLNLNGKNITRTVSATKNQQVFTVAEGAKLVIADTTEIPETAVATEPTVTQGTVTAEYADGVTVAPEQGKIIQGAANSQISISGGIIDGSAIACTQIMDSTKTRVPGGTVMTEGELTISGGHVKGIAHDNGRGSAIGGGEDSVITITGTAVIDGNTAAEGCAVYSLGIVNVSGGTMNGADGFTNGGTLYTKNGELHISDGIVNGAEGTSGGTVYINGSAMTVSGGTINGGSATNGGTIYINGAKSSLTISGGIVNGGTAANQGGAVFNYNGELEITGGTVNGGTAKSGVAIYTNKPTTISGGTINVGTFTADGTFGLSVYCNKADLTISGETVINGGVTVRGADGAAVVLTIGDKVIIGEEGGYALQLQGVTVKNAAAEILAEQPYETQTMYTLVRDPEGNVTGVEVVIPAQDSSEEPAA